ncbi:MAG: uracil-DNA glycosylase [Succinivibrionaceae bacterium]
MTTWHDVIGLEKNKDYFKKIMNFVEDRRKTTMVYPPKEDVFNAFKYTSFDNLKVVIIGQDPYHGPNQAHGLCFSVKPNIAIPPSLKNIYTELHSEYGDEFIIPHHGYLARWAEQGVFMLNNTLTVEAGRPQSHAQIGWNIFTDKVIEQINAYTQNTVFMLWGSPAQQKCKHVDTSKHLVLKAPHPSPLSAYRGFFGCNHFKLCNAYLVANKKNPIDWKLPLQIND